MKVKVNFGFSAVKEANWWGEVDSFPKIISLNGDKWEFVFYDTDPSKHFDYILTFSPLPYYHINFNADCNTWDYYFGGNSGKCECGSIYSSFPQGHMFYCRLYKKF